MVAETQAAAGAIIAVGDARSSTGKLPTPDLESVKKLLTQTKAIGIILPPPDIRAIVDKTAQFVAKNGARGGSCCTQLQHSSMQPNKACRWPHRMCNGY